MAFQHYEAWVKLPDDVWAAFPQVQIFLSQAGEELRIVIVPYEAERYFLSGVVQDQPELLFLHEPSVFRFGEFVLPWQP